MTKQILLIEDDARLAEMVRDYLGESGFDVTIAGKGTEGLALHREHGFDARASPVTTKSFSGMTPKRA